MNRTWKKDFGSLVPALRAVHCEVATTTNGTLAATQENKGLKLTKTAGKVGRYTCQLLGVGNVNADAVKWINAVVTLLGPDDAALTDGKGVWQGDLRDEDIGTGAKDGTIEIQFVDADTRADAEVQDGTVLYVTLFISESNTA
jgi:hypothetical protein